MMNKFLKSSAVVTLLSPLALGGCSSSWMPDWFDDDGTAEVQDAPGGDRDYPSVADTPEALQATAAEERAQIAEGLRADNARNRYAANSITRQDETSDEIPMAQAPAPMAAPTSPVMAAPMPVAPMPMASAAPAPVAVSPMEPAQPVPPMPWLGPRPQPMQVVTSEAQAGAMMPSRPGQAAFAAGIYDPTMAGPVVISGTGLQSPFMEPQAYGQDTLTAVDRQNFMPGNALKVATIQFQDGSSQLSGQDRHILRQVVALHKEHGGVVRVVGHASSRTRDMEPVRHKMVNLDMSSQRADTVARELVRLGAAESLVQTAAVADHEPRFFEVMPAGEAGNRRTEIYFLR
ncbi:OmpA family protein [Magnetospira thiophila]